MVGQKQQQPVKVLNKEKNESSNKIKEQNQRINDFEAKLDNIVKRPVSASVNPNRISSKIEKKKMFSPKKIKINLNLEKKQDKDSKNINLIISSQQQLHDTFFFLKNDKSDDTKFFQKVVYLINRLCLKKSMKRYFLTKNLYKLNKYRKISRRSGNLFSIHSNHRI